MRTYGDIYDKALNVLNLDVSNVEDYRPADPMFIPQLMRGISMGIIIWLKTGEKVVFIDCEDGE